MKTSLFILSVSFLGLIAACSSAPEVHTERQPSSHHHDMSGMKGEVQGTLSDCANAQGFSDQVSSAQQDVINQIVGGRGHRLLHALWHATRAGLSAQESKQAVHAFGTDWTAEHKYCPPPTTSADAANYNPVGEDFLFMHREMIEMIRAGMISKNLQCIKPWLKVPTLQDWPLPDNDTSGPKSAAALKQLQTWDAQMQNQNWLRSVSLSQLGMALEITTHNNLHMRYSTTKPPAGFPGVNKTGGAPIPFDGRFSAKWPYDNYTYNWLADPYGAALNPIFWKIHGYVDGMIDRWLAANNYKTIAAQCPQGDRSCYQWRGTWTGSVPSDLGLKDSDSRNIAANSSGDVDGKTTSFNQARMHKQWTGVIGGDPSEGPKVGAPGGSGSKAILDPFQYAVQQECGNP